ncbi:LrgB family protein [Phytohalomonas tamaricis]|uniref:LrgB family protein n=1 Tax=Phytohalomonas tamaricis TaxID=2081032 RepID=UPI000D0BA6E7
MLESLAPKAAITPLAVGSSTRLGSIATLTVGVVTIIGILATSITPGFAHRLRCTEPRIRGFALGINGHGVLTMRGFPLALRSAYLPAWPWGSMVLSVQLYFLYAPLVALPRATGASFTD